MQAAFAISYPILVSCMVSNFLKLFSFSNFSFIHFSLEFIDLHEMSGALKLGSKI